jgi:hypothetical protein
MVQSGEAGKGEEILCGDCLPAASCKQEIVCDRCHTSFHADNLRQGEAMFLSRTNTALAQLLCKHCAIVSRVRRSESKDVRVVVTIFLSLLAVPLVAAIVWHGFFATASKNGVESKELRQLAEETRLLRDTLTAAQQRETERQKEWQSLRESAMTRGSSAKEEKKPPDDTGVSPQMLQELAATLAQARTVKSRKQFQGALPERLEAVLQIAALREEAALPFLLEGLNDKDPLVRSLSARLLGSLAQHTATGQLLIALKDTDPLVRKAVAQALSLLTREQFVFFADVPPEKWQKLQKFKERQKEKNLRDKENEGK